MTEPESLPCAGTQRLAWHSADEQLPPHHPEEPDDSVFVLVVTTSGWIGVAAYSYKYGQWEVEDGLPPLSPVTHWQFLPPPPEKTNV